MYQTSKKKKPSSMHGLDKKKKKKRKNRFQAEGATYTKTRESRREEKIRHSLEKRRNTGVGWGWRMHWAQSMSGPEAAQAVHRCIALQKRTHCWAV